MGGVSLLVVILLYCYIDILLDCFGWLIGVSR